MNDIWKDGDDWWHHPRPKAPAKDFVLSPIFKNKILFRNQISETTFLFFLR